MSDQPPREARATQRPKRATAPNRQAASDHSELTFQTIRSARRYLERLTEPRGARVLLRGLIVSRWRRGQRAGCWLQDITGRANVVSSPGDPDSIARNGHVGSRVWIRGTAEIAAQGEIVVHPDEYRLLSRDSVLALPTDPASKFVPPSHIVDSYLLVRLRTLASRFVENEGFRQFEPYYLSKPLPNSAEETLRVAFRGWGGDIVLASSPAPQLLEILLTTGEERVFAVARCFSYAYRDGVTSAEMLGLIGRGIDMTIEDVVGLSESAVRALLRDEDTGLSDADAEWLQRPWVKHRQAIPPNTSVSEPLVQIEQLASGPHPGETFAIVIPPGLTVAEGDVSNWSSDVSIAGFTIHLERIVSLLSARHLGRLRPLGIGGGGGQGDS